MTPTRRPRATTRTLLVRRARSIPPGLWDAKQQLDMRGLIDDLLRDVLVLREEVRVLRAVRRV